MPSPVLAFIFAIAFAFVLPVRSAMAADKTISIEYQGRERTALIHIPTGYDKEKPMPLLRVMHGGGGNAANAARMARIDRLADQQGFLVVYPNGTGPAKIRLLTRNAWDCCGYAMTNRVDDVGFIRALVKQLKGTYAIDAKRIYATGLSNGAIMSHRLGCELSDVVAAIAPVAGGLNTDVCTPSEPVSVIMFHGTADEHFRYNGGDAKRVAGAVPRQDKPIPYAFST